MHNPVHVNRFTENPLLIPADVEGSKPGLRVACLLNPGAFRYNGKIFLLVRVAERPEQSEVSISFPVLNEKEEIEIKEIALNDGDLIATDARVIQYKGVYYLTTLSHLRLFSSTDGRNFKEDKDYLPLTGKGRAERFGIEDCRVTKIDGLFYLTYTAVSEAGVAVGMRTTRDWKSFQHHGIIFPPYNKDVALFPGKINGKFYAFHRPSFGNIHYIWMASSEDGLHWGRHQCILQTRPGYWDSARVGAGASPIRTEQGWLEIYHGATAEHRYCLGAVLMDLNDPYKIIARSEKPLMEPQEPYELTGFFGHVVFTNGHIINGDTLTVYYGAADELVCAADFSISAILQDLTGDSKTTGGL